MSASVPSVAPFHCQTKKPQFAYESKPLVCVMRKCNITAPISAYSLSYCESGSGLVCPGLKIGSDNPKIPFAHRKWSSPLQIEWNICLSISLMCFFSERVDGLHIYTCKWGRGGGKICLAKHTPICPFNASLVPLIRCGLNWNHLDN